MVAPEGTFLASFGFAFRGLAEGWRQERNFRIQCGYALLVAVLLGFCKPDAALALLVGVAVAVLLAAELMNSALERAVDLCVREFHPLARSAKDLAAGSVLLLAITSALVNLAVFGHGFGPALQGALAFAMGAFLWTRFASGGRR